ncbi:MAG: DUF1501 domain-containing protein [Planctomycetales bacterium]|nr:DUF1501 domain-containing protein [Planctomycetales bacterium]
MTRADRQSGPVFAGTCSRREAFGRVACGFGSLALASLAGESARAERLDTTQPPHFTPRAKRMVFLFMQGGPSQIDTFEPKPRLDRDDGKPLPFLVARTRQVSEEKLLASPWQFRQYGQCGRWVSELFPRMAQHVDDLCFLHGLHTEGVAHGPATLMLHTGATSVVRPSLGSWLSYGLGTENSNFPAFVTLSPSARMGGPRNYSAAFLPSSHQGTIVGRAERPFREASIRHLSGDSLDDVARRRQFGWVQALNRQQLKQTPAHDAHFDGLIDAYELAFRMQRDAPELLDLSGETAATLAAYGVGTPETDDYGRQCLMARRMIERGVRFVQVNYSDNSNNPRWDQHSHLERHETHARAVDRPIAALLADMKARGLLEDTLIWWGAEFGRTPFAQNRNGRDHNPKGFTAWLAGAGVKPGFAFGATDEFGYEAVDGRVHMHDMHATLLHLLGLDHTRLTYRYSGRDFRLTDVHGRVVKDILS